MDLSSKVVGWTGVHSNVLKCLNYIFTRAYLSELSIYLILGPGTGRKGKGSLHISVRFPSILVLVYCQNG